MKFETVYNVDNELDDLLFEYSFMLDSVERLTSHDDYLKILDKQKKKIIEYIASSITIVCKPDVFDIIEEDGCYLTPYQCKPGFMGL